MAKQPTVVGREAAPKRQKRGIVGGREPGREKPAQHGPAVRLPDDLFDDERIRDLLDTCIIPALVEKFIHTKGLADGVAPEDEGQP